MDEMNHSSDAQLQPRLHHASAIRADPSLARTITSFVNEGYRYISPSIASRWETDGSDRLATPSAIHEALGNDGMFAVIYDARDDTNPIACAATTPWTRDLEGFCAAGETGWEIKTVTTRVECMRRGLAQRCVDALVAELVRQAREDGDGEKLQVWVQAVEDMNGAFWRKKRWVDVRAYEKPAGHWGSKFGYRLLVLLQECDVN